MKKCILITISILLSVLPIYGDFSHKTIRFSLGNGIQPWVLPETNSGIIIDIIKETLEPAGYKIIYLYVPYARRLRLYKLGRADAVMDVNARILKDYGAPLKGYISDIAYAYKNIAVSLKKNKFKFTKISQLVDYRVVAWQGAGASIGGEFAIMSGKNQNYRELANQELPIRMLYASHADVIPLDETLFEYYRNKMVKEANFRLNLNQPIDKFALFEKNECGFLFSDEKVQIIFNQNLKKLKSNGRYLQILKKYSSNLEEHP